MAVAHESDHCVKQPPARPPSILCPSFIYLIHLPIPVPPSLLSSLLSASHPSSIHPHPSPVQPAIRFPCVLPMASVLSLHYALSRLQVLYSAFCPSLAQPLTPAWSFPCLLPAPPMCTWSCPCSINSSAPRRAPQCPPLSRPLSGAGGLLLVHHFIGSCPPEHVLSGGGTNATLGARTVGCPWGGTN